MVWVNSGGQLGLSQPRAHSPAVGWGVNQKGKNVSFCVLITDPKHSTVQAAMKKINSITVKTSTLRYHCLL